MNKQITLDILTGLSAREAGRKYGVTHQAAGRIVDRVVRQARAKSIHSVPDHFHTVKEYKRISSRLIPIVHNHYKEI